MLQIIDDSKDYEIILMEDFNVDAFKYAQFQDTRNDIEKVPKKYELIEKLTLKNFYDAHYRTEDGKIMATFSRTVEGTLRQSRIDYIWVSQSLISSIVLNKLGHQTFIIHQTIE